MLAQLPGLQITTEMHFPIGKWRIEVTLIELVLVSNCQSRHLTFGLMDSIIYNCQER